MLQSYLAYTFWTLMGLGFVVVGLGFIEGMGWAGPAAYHH
jgi:hypothetical protein